MHALGPTGEEAMEGKRAAEENQSEPSFGAEEEESGERRREVR